MQSNTTPDLGHHMGKENITCNRAKRSSLSYQVTTRLQGRDKSVGQTKNDPQKKNRFGTVSKTLIDDLNMFDGTNLALISDLDQDT